MFRPHRPHHQPHVHHPGHLPHVHHVHHGPHPPHKLHTSHGSSGEPLPIAVSLLLIAGGVGSMFVVGVTVLGSLLVLAGIVFLIEAWWKK
jgi:hypothetical protein